jgi:hypothetical protein
MSRGSNVLSFLSGERMQLDPEYNRDDHVGTNNVEERNDMDTVSEANEDEQANDSLTNSRSNDDDDDDDDGNNYTNNNSTENDDDDDDDDDDYEMDLANRHHIILNEDIESDSDTNTYYDTDNQRNTTGDPDPILGV